MKFVVQTHFLAILAVQLFDLMLSCFTFPHMQSTSARPNSMYTNDHYLL